MADIAEVRKMIEPVISSHGYDLVRVKLMDTEAGRTLQVMAEDPATGQLLIDQCAALSRELSDLLDEADPIDGEYNLEVSSPGIDRPLTRAKDFAAWAGHRTKVTMREPVEGRKKFQGTLLGLDADGGAEFVRLRVEDGSGDVHRLPLADIHSAKLVLTDDLIAATQPQTFN